MLSPLRLVGIRAARSVRLADSLRSLTDGDLYRLGESVTRRLYSEIGRDRADRLRRIRQAVDTEQARRWRMEQGWWMEWRGNDA